MNRDWIITMIAALVACSAYAADLPGVDVAKVEAITGWKGNVNETERVLKISKPRDDVKASVDGLGMAPFMGLTSWAAFTPTNEGGAMVMGDMVLFEDEVNPAMSAAFSKGLDVTALHNHFFFDRPKVYFMHIGGSGDAAQLAQGVRAISDAVKDVRGRNRLPNDSFGAAKLPAKNSITTGPLEAILGKGDAKDGMFKAVFGRTTEMHGHQVGKEMGVNTWAAFAGSDDNAVVDGDFAVIEDELQPTLRSLRASGINIVAIHNHMTHESPRIIFFHYWGRGKATDLAQAVKRALAEGRYNTAAP